MIKRIVWLLMLLLFVSGYSPIYTEEDAKEETKEEQRPNFSLDDIKELTKEVSKLRGLEFKNPVKASFKDKAELRKKMTEMLKEEWPDAEIVKAQKTLIKIGLIPKNTDLKKLLIDLLTEQVAGFYDPKDKELCLIKQEEAGKLPEGAEIIEKTFGIPYDYITAVHELAHALQDQYFDLLSLPLQTDDNDDLAVAIQSVMEGEASFVMYDYLFRKAGQDFTRIPDVSGMVDQMPAQSGMEVMDKAPAYLKETLVFPYTQGLVFVHTLKRKDGWEAITKLYDKLPASTEQILHPKKYYGDTPDWPTAIKIPDLAKILPADEWDLLWENTLGELAIKILFNEFPSEIGAKRIAAGWDGDRLITYENKKSHEIIMVWFSTWDTVEDATEFKKGYAELITKKYKDYKLTKDEENQSTWSKDGTVIYLSRKDKDVVIIETVPEKLLSSLVETIIKDTKCSELKEIKRLDPEKRKKAKETPSGKPEEKK